MSGHTEGRIVVHQSGSQAFLLNEKDDDVAFDISEEDARRLAAAWNVCEGIDTESLETGATLADICERSNDYQFELSAANTRIAKLEALVAERDTWLGQRPCQQDRCNVLNEAKKIPVKLSYGQGALDYVDGWNACLDAMGKDK